MNPIPVNEPLLNGNERQYLLECIDSGWISSKGHLLNNLKSNLLQELIVNMGLLLVTVLLL